MWNSGKTHGRRGSREDAGAGEEPDREVTAWVSKRLGFQPDAMQSRLLAMDGRRVVMNCTRQWGKSTVTAAKAVYQAFHVAESLTLVVSPSARQTGEFLRKAGRFVRRLQYA